MAGVRPSGPLSDPYDDDTMEHDLIDPDDGEPAIEHIHS